MTQLEMQKQFEVHEERMAFLFDMIVGLRDKQTDPELRESLNSMKYVLSGRPGCVPEASALLSAQAREIERLKEAVFWACGAHGDFPGSGDRSKGAFFWRSELRKRAGITDEELNDRAARQTQAGGE